MNGQVKEFYEENGKRIFLYLMLLCKNEQIAEELTQETFYRALNSIKKYNGESSPYTWLCGIAKNVWREYVRKNRNLTEDISEIDTTDNSPTPAEMCEKEKTI